MNWIADVRRLSWLPRAVLAMLVLATAQTAILPCAMAAEVEHCVYCPPASHDVDHGDCVYPDDPADMAVAAAQQFAALFVGVAHWYDFPAFEQRHEILVRAALDVAPPPARPLTLTHCVQLR